MFPDSGWKQVIVVQVMTWYRTDDNLEPEPIMTLFIPWRVVFILGRVVFILGRVVFILGRVVFILGRVVFILGRVAVNRISTVSSIAFSGTIKHRSSSLLPFVIHRWPCASNAEIVSLWWHHDRPMSMGVLVVLIRWYFRCDPLIDTNKPG